MLITKNNPVSHETQQLQIVFVATGKLFGGYDSTKILVYEFMWQPSFCVDDFHQFLLRCDFDPLGNPLDEVAKRSGPRRDLNTICFPLSSYSKNTFFCKCGFG